MIHTRGLTRIFDRPESEPLTTVDNLSLDVAPGEIFGFLAPNGADKTMTIRRSVGLLTETPGMYDQLYLKLMKQPAGK